MQRGTQRFDTTQAWTVPRTRDMLLTRVMRVMRVMRVKPIMRFMPVMRFMPIMRVMRAMRAMRVMRVMRFMPSMRFMRFMPSMRFMPIMRFMPTIRFMPSMRFMPIMLFTLSVVSVPPLVLGAGCGADTPAAGALEADARASSLVLARPGGEETALTLDELAARVAGGPQIHTVFNKVYEKQIRYRGYWLRDVLDAAALARDGVDELIFHCADGYAPSLAIDRLDALKLFLAVEQLDAPGGARWEEVRVGKDYLSPGPFYVVGEQPGSYDAFPWPFQVIKIEGVSFDEANALMYPNGAPAGGAVMRGFERFRQDCLMCHSMNLQGGTVGPELNVPRSIVEYRDPDTLRAFIKNPGDFRARSRMPRFPDLTPADMDALMAYLEYMKGRKRGSR